MSNEIVFRTQLTSIMEVLANAAVEEICKLVNDGYAILNLEISEYQKENESLKMQLHMMELKAAQGCVERVTARENSLTNCFDGAAGENPRGTSKEGPNLAAKRVFGSSRGLGPPAPHRIRDQFAETENTRTAPVLIKEENSEECSDPKTDLDIHGQGASEPSAGDAEVDPVAMGVEVSPSPVRADEMDELHGTGHSVWEVSGSEAVLNSETQNKSVRQKRLKRAVAVSEQGAGQLSGRGSEAILAYEAPGRPLTFIGLEIRNPSCSLGTGDTEGQLVCPDPQLIPNESEGASVDTADLKPSVMVMESVKAESESLLCEWDKESAPLTGNAQHRRYGDSETGEEMHPELINVMLHPHAQLRAAAEIATVTASTASNFDLIGLDGSVTRKRSFAAPEGPSSVKEKRFICKYCGKGFNRQNALDIHQRVHTGEKPFRCAQCGKQFSDSSNHRRHQSVHSRERPFSCTQCERSFSHHYQLRVHQRIHTGDRPYSCVHCGKRFGERSFLRIHQQRDHALLYAT
ncbi:hypothetical protein JZ751_016383 [Albula glossodonta]|uniref:C2H2-type domain-containing protein n=1 Tax=Albula glossodonta TaxID=121402 RepID=A0A8T2NY72_9TELE|nr:hypothetical protein JZ751_016383 [Albula glossodonta]